MSLALMVFLLSFLAFSSANFVVVTMYSCKIPWQGIAFDDMLRKQAAGFYAVYPAFAFQSNTASDNDSCRRLERIRRLWGGLRRIQKANEFYHRHKAIVIAVHIVFVLILLKLVLPI